MKRYGYIMSNAFQSITDYSIYFAMFPSDQIDLHMRAWDMSNLPRDKWSVSGRVKTDPCSWGINALFFLLTSLRGSMGDGGCSVAFLGSKQFRRELVYGIYMGS